MKVHIIKIRNLRQVQAMPAWVGYNEANLTGHAV